jgi:hypothetical protein
MQMGYPIRRLQPTFQNPRSAFGSRREFFNTMLAYGGLATLAPLGKGYSAGERPYASKGTNSTETKRLTSGPLLDWFYVHAGYVNYRNGFAERWDVPEGVEIAVQPAEKSDPLIMPDR